MPVKAIQNPVTKQDTNSLIAQNQNIAAASAILPVTSVYDAMQKLNQAQAQLNNFDTGLESGQNVIQGRIEPLTEQQGQLEAQTRQYGAVRNALARAVDTYTNYLNMAQQERQFQLQKSQADRQYNLDLQRLRQGGMSYGKIGTTVDEWGNQVDQYGFINLNNGTISSANGGGGGGVNLDALRESIGKYESGGNYKAIGKITANGDRAYGKYQIMGNNIPSWTKAALGYSMTPQQFLNSPEAQDAVANHYMGMNLNRYGTIEDVASVWFSGRPASKAGNAKDVNGTSVPAYIRNIQANYRKIAGSLPSGGSGAGGSSTSSSTILNSYKSIAPRLSADARKSAQATLSGYLNNGDTEGAKQFVLSTAISALPMEQQNKAFGRLQAIDQLNNIEHLLAQYKAKGGNTNILSGKQEQVLQKLGTTGNPELAYIGTQIATSIIAYRNAVSGAAFTESEAKQYESLFPSTKGTLTLNEAKINGLRDVFNANQKSVMKTVLGDRNYDELMTQASPYDAYARSVQQMSPEQLYAAQIASGIKTQPQQTQTKKATNVGKAISYANPVNAITSAAVNLGARAAAPVINYVAQRPTVSNAIRSGVQTAVGPIGGVVKSISSGIKKLLGR